MLKTREMTEVPVKGDRVEAQQNQARLASPYLMKKVDAMLNWKLGLTRPSISHLCRIAVMANPNNKMKPIMKRHRKQNWAGCGPKYLWGARK